MKTLNQVLSAYSRPDVTALGGAGEMSLDETTRTALLRDLKEIHSSNSRLVLLPVGLLIVLFVVGLILILRYHDQPAIYAAISGGLGISCTGCVLQMLKIWREKTSTELLLRLAVDLRGEALSTVISTLANRSKTAT